VTTGTETAALPEVEAYFANLADEQRGALLALRRVIKRAAPEAVEVISYGLPTFKLHGSLVALGSAKKHCALYHMSSHLRDRLGEELDGFDTSKGTIRFSPENPLPVDLVEKIVKLRIDENLEIASARASRKKEKKASGV
jgi:uncharacterized protein YdhG (YjbR/CyaY superfamily)